MPLTCKTSMMSVRTAVYRPAVIAPARQIIWTFAKIAEEKLIPLVARLKPGASS